MNQNNKMLCLSAALVLAGCTADPLPSDEQSSVPGNHVIFVHQQPQEKSYSVAVKFQQNQIEKVERSVEASRSSASVSRSGIAPFDEFMSRSGAVSFQRIFPEGKFEKRTRKSGLHLWYEVKFDSSIEQSVIQENLKDMAGIQIVEFPAKIKAITPEPITSARVQSLQEEPTNEPSYPVNDPYLYKQWNYHNDGTYPGNAVATADINLFKAWERCMGHPDVIVSVIDEAVNYKHPDLKENMWVNQAEADGQPGVDDDHNGFVDDVHGFNFVYNTPELTNSSHGTHVAGTIAAVNNNGIGVCGIAGGSGKADGVKIMTCQIMDDMHQDQTREYYHVAKAVKYAADNGAVISQNSWGLDANPDYWGSSIDSSMSMEAYQYFIDYAGIDENGKTTGPIRGGVVVFCTGNDGLVNQGIPVWPPAYSPFVAVSSIGCDFRPAYYTDYGNWVDVAAPGGDQMFDEGGTGILSTSTQDGNSIYVEMQGTSMACPHVSGVAALVASYARQNNVVLTGSQVAEILVTSTRNIDDHFVGTKDYGGSFMNDPFHLRMSDYKGLMGGLVDASKALDGVDQILGKPVEHVSPSLNYGPMLNEAGPDFLSLKWKVSADCKGQPLQSYAVYFSQSPIETKNGKVVMKRELEGPIRVSTKHLKVGDWAMVQLPRLEYETAYYVALVGSDQWREESAPLSTQFKTQFDSWGNPVKDTKVVERSDNSVTLQWTETADGKNRPYDHYLLQYKKGSYWNRETVRTEVPSTGKVGNLCQAVLEGLTPDTEYEVSISGINREGVTCRPIQVTVATKRRLTLNPMFTQPLVMDYWKETVIYYRIQKGEGATVQARLLSDSEHWDLTLSNFVELRFKAPVLDVTSGKFKLELTDEKGGRYVTEEEYRISPNRAPGKSKNIGDYFIQRIGEKVVIHPEEYFSDPNHEPLLYQVTQEGESVDIEIDKGTISFQAVKNGETRISIRATDMGGESVESVFKIKVFEMPAGKEMLLYPNPVKNVLHVRMADGIVGDVKISILSADGKEVMNVQRVIKADQSVDLDVTSLRAGYLWVKVEHEGKTYKGSVVKI